jgi:hypothetical protein
MKTTLFWSVLAAGLFTVSTATFARNFAAYAQAVGDAGAAQQTVGVVGAAGAPATRPHGHYYHRRH